MKKKTITITASVAIINAIGLVLLQQSTQKVLFETFYLKDLKQTVQICLS